MNVECVTSNYTFGLESTDPEAILFGYILNIYCIYSTLLFIFVRLQIFSSVAIFLLLQFVVFWVIAACSVLVGYQCFRVPCCLRLQG
jgi:hypothetical protein